MKLPILYIFLIISVLGCVKDDPKFTNKDYACDVGIENTHPDSERFQSFLDESVADGVPGITMLIETPEGIWSGAAGVADIPNNVPMSSCNMHQIGSISKTFTATIILKLQEQGKLKIGDKMSKYLDKSLIDQVANWDAITIKNLLNHTSGIPDFLDIKASFGMLNDPTYAWSAREEVELVYNVEQVFAPGTKRDYSNTNYSLLGLIAEEITGKTGATLMKEMIFEPLNMTSSYFNQDGKLPAGLVRGYYDEFEDGVLKDVTEISAIRNSMAAGVISNVEDLNTYVRACTGSNQMFTDETIAQMLAVDDVPFLTPEKWNYDDSNKVEYMRTGLGWFIIQTRHGRGFGMNGSYHGRKARMWYFPDTGSSVVFLVNGSGGALNTFAKQTFRNDMIRLVFE